MAEIKKPQQVMPIAGLIYVKEFTADNALQKLIPEVGGILMKSASIPFTHTRYYHKEMGDELIRQWCVFRNLIAPDMLIQLKHKTNDIEKQYLNETGGRKINIDPGLLSLSNIILASTKNYSHRIYLGNGIYGEITLIYKSGCFNTLEWTYPDYREKIVLTFFEKARENLQKRLKLDG